MSNEEIVIIKEVLKSFIVKIRNYDLFNQIYTYYISEINQANKETRIQIGLNYDSLKLQIDRKILSQKNNYWDLKDSEIAIIEKNILDKNFDKNFKDYTNFLLKEDLHKLLEEVNNKEIEEKNTKEENIKKILIPNENLLIQPVMGLMKNNVEFPYKSDKIKALLILKLNTEQIFYILSNFEKFNAPRSYIEKYRQEREQLIKERKITEYPLEEEIKEINSKL